ncbi:M48 family metallopeptidase [Streptosporangium sp. NPDC020072]|uniref:M48 family metallopeptidase n=1 Tax=Streptosporangium sp. NPDC020072 TaxID=3154788 RepID=UPI003435A7FD
MIAVRALLALGLLAGPCLLGLVLVLLDAGVLVLFVWDAPALGRPSRAGTVTAALTAIPALWILRRLFVTGAGVRPAPDGVPVTPGQAPELWAVVTELAGRLGTRPPATLRLTAEVDAELTEETRLLGLVGGRRHLRLGLPLLAGLTADELRAALCHELGHHAPTGLGAVVYRGHLALRAVLDRLERPRTPDPAARGVPVSWIRWPLSGYARLYLWVSSAVNRRQELQADAAAARAVEATGAAGGTGATGGTGGTVAAEALWRTLVVLPVAWGEFRDRYLDPMYVRGYLPDDPPAVFAAMLASSGYRAAIEGMEHATPSRRTSRHDPHPSVERRMRALGGRREPAGRGRTTALEAGFEVRPGAVRHCLFPGERERRAVLPWQEWVGLTMETLATEPVRGLVRAARRVGGTARPALETVLDLLADGRAGRLAACLGPQEERSGKETAGSLARLETALFALVGQALVVRGRANWETTWTGPSRLAWSERGRAVAAGVTVGEIHSLVAAAVLGGAPEVRRLRLRLAALGVDPGTWLGHDAEGTPQAEEPVATAGAPVAVGVERARRSRRRFTLRLAGAALIGILFLVTAVSSVSDTPEEPEDSEPAGVFVTPWREITPAQPSLSPHVPPETPRPSPGPGMVRRLHELLEQEFARRHEDGTKR